jgi:tubulin-specific chaperone D
METAGEEQEIRLQRASADLLADLERSLRPFLWRTPANGESRIRRKVRFREIRRLLTLVWKYLGSQGYEADIYVPSTA